VETKGLVSLRISLASPKRFFHGRMAKFLNQRRLIIAGCGRKKTGYFARLSLGPPVTGSVTAVSTRIPVTKASPAINAVWK